MRDLTCKVLEAIDEGVLGAKAVAEMCLGYMNEDDIRDMLRQNDVLEAVEPDDEDEDFDDIDDADFDSFADGEALASAGFGTDEDYGMFGE
jgi:hypothetical protein